MTNGSIELKPSRETKDETDLFKCNGGGVWEGGISATIFHPPPQNHMSK